MPEHDLDDWRRDRDRGAAPTLRQVRDLCAVALIGLGATVAAAVTCIAAFRTSALLGWFTLACFTLLLGVLLGLDTSRGGPPDADGTDDDRTG